jgi:nitrate reductase NapAB chaperone NapD
MPIRSYVVLPEAGARDAVAKRLKSIPACDALPAENRDLVLLVTDTETGDEDEALFETVRQVVGVRSLVLTFGEVDPAPDRVRSES